MNGNRAARLPYWKLLGLSVALAAAFFAAAESVSTRSDFWFWLFSPAWLFASLLSGNVHNFSTAVANVAMVVEIHVLVLLGYWSIASIWASFTRRRGRTRAPPELPPR